jgi:hypothetical protein
MTGFGEIIIPVETMLKETYVHELFHAEHNANGIPLAGGRRLTQAVCAKTRIMVIHFLGELVAYNSTHEYFKETGNPLAELISLHGMMQYVDKVMPVINQQVEQDPFSPEEVKLITKQYELAKTLEAEWVDSYERIMKQLQANPTQ